MVLAARQYRAAYLAHFPCPDSDTTCAMCRDQDLWRPYASNAAASGHIACLEVNYIRGGLGLAQEAQEWTEEHRAHRRTIHLLADIAGCGRLQYLELLYGRTPTRMDTTLVAECAAAGGHNDCLRLVRSWGNVRRWHVVMEAAAAHGRPETLALVWDWEGSSAVNAEALMLRAAEKGHVAVMKEIRRRTELRVTSYLLQRAVACKDVECLELLHEWARADGADPARMFRDAVDRVYKLGNVLSDAACVRFLASPSVSFAFYLPSVMDLAARTNNVGLAMLALELEPESAQATAGLDAARRARSSSKLAREGFMIAVLRQHYECAAELRSYASWPAEDAIYAEALCKCARAAINSDRGAFATTHERCAMRDAVIEWCPESVDQCFEQIIGHANAWWTELDTRAAHALGWLRALHGPAIEDATLARARAAFDTAIRLRSASHISMGGPEMLKPYADRVAPAARQLRVWARQRAHRRAVDAVLALHATAPFVLLDVLGWAYADLNAFDASEYEALVMRAYESVWRAKGATAGGI